MREQGGLVGIAHPFDRFRGSLGRGETTEFEALAGLVDWIEAWNARLMVGDGNARAAELAARLGVPGVAVSDAHTTLEVGIASTTVRGDPSTPDGLRAALAGTLDLGRAARPPTCDCSVPRRSSSSAPAVAAASEARTDG